VDLWNLALAALFFCAMGTFAGAAALYLTATPVRLLGGQTAEIVLFCLFAIALFAVIATLRQTTREITPKRPTAWLGRQDSNLGMAESKSNWFALFVNAHSEKSQKFDFYPINSLANISEWRHAGHPPEGRPPPAPLRTQRLVASLIS
jgi:hypothetical protein